jgi:arginine exporter protein ArgO
LSSTPIRSVKFPLVEGIGIFIGVVAWDLLIDGAPDLLKALLIAAPCMLVWYAIRRWKWRQ